MQAERAVCGIEKGQIVVVGHLEILLRKLHRLTKGAKAVDAPAIGVLHVHSLTLWTYPIVCAYFSLHKGKAIPRQFYQFFTDDVLIPHELLQFINPLFDPVSALTVYTPNHIPYVLRESIVWEFAT